jgi:hypothetical protein
VQFFHTVLSDAQTPAPAGPTQAAFHRPAATFQQVAAGGQEPGGEHQEQDKSGEEPGRIERQ